MNAAPTALVSDRDRLVADHLDVVRRIARRMARRYPAGIALEDLVAAGMLGLAEAASRYDGSRREPFLGFAEKRIRGAILDELRRGDIMPRRVRRRARQVGQAIRAVEQRTGGPADDGAVAAELGVTVATYREQLEALVHVKIGALDDAVLPPAADLPPDVQAERRLVLARIRAGLARLQPRDVLVLSLHYADDLSYQEIAEVLGVTVSRVCQLHGRAIARLRVELESGRVSA